MLVDNNKASGSEKPEYIPIIKSTISTITCSNISDNLWHKYTAAGDKHKPPLVLEESFQQHITFIGQNYI